MKKTILLAIAVYLISSIGLLYGYLHTPSGMIFLGGHLPNSGEILNMVLPQLREGHLLIKNLFTSEPQPRIFFAPSYLPMALLGQILPVNNFLLVQLGRFFYTILFFIIAFKFFKLLKLKNIFWAFLLLGFSSGFGLFLKWGIPNSADLWIPEINTFHSLLFSPNIIFSQILMMLSLMTFFKGYTLQKWKYFLLSGAFATLLAFEHQFDAVTVLLTILIFLLLTETKFKIWLKKIFSLWSIFFGPILVFGLYYFLIKQNWSSLIWTNQNHLYSPPLLSYISGFGLIGIGAFLAIIKSKNKKNSSYHLILSWLIAVIIVIYSPLPFQRRFGEGMHIPLVILSSYYLWELVQKLKKIPFRLGLFFLLLFSAATNFYLLYLDIKAYQLSPNESPFYIYQEDLTALSWLRNNSSDKDVILADGLYSPLIPGLIGRTVYFGHSVGTALTIDPEKKTEQAKNFFFYDSDEKRQKFLENNKITFFFLGKKAAAAEDFSLWEGKDYFRKVFERQDVKVFKVKNSLII
ncbi:hypothetical protein HY030_00990 [Candidatus Gottesmanbacteria bacterium]|nr:hypothetical protein [Candidatus Gottesmanbacteria bacterium]